MNVASVEIYIKRGINMTIDELWYLLKKHDGETFYTKRNFKFIYRVSDDFVTIYRFKPNSNFKSIYKALKSDFEFGINRPNEARNVYRDNMHRVSSYVLGILKDPRIGTM